MSRAPTAGPLSSPTGSVDTLRTAGRPSVRLTDATCATHRDARTGRVPETVVVADGLRWRNHLPAESWQFTVWARSSPKNSANTYRGANADVVIDLHDPTWPVIHHIDSWFATDDIWYRTETQAFFAAPATIWDTKFGDDLPAYAAAVAEAHLPAGGTVIDVGCGTGRAFPALRDAIGPTGTVIGVDLTPQMLTVAKPRAVGSRAILVLADGRHLPVANAAAGAVVAAGLLMHVPDTDAGLREPARIRRAGGQAGGAPEAGPVVVLDTTLYRRVLCRQPMRTGAPS